MSHPALRAPRRAHDWRFRQALLAPLQPTGGPGSRWSARPRPSASGRTYLQPTRIVRALCAVADRCWQPLAAAVAVTVAVIRAMRPRLAPFPAGCLLVRRPFPHRTDCCRPIRRREGGPRVVSRVRQPGTFTCARCPAVTAALDAVPEAYHNPAAVWWGPLQLPRSSGIRWSCRPGRRSPRSTAPVTGSPPGRCMAYGRQGRMATVCRRFHVISTCSSPGPQMGVVACSDGPPGPRYWPVLTEEEL